MKIEFKKARLENFGPYRNTELTFDKKGFTKIIGMNETGDDNSSSNGAGKSYVLSSISWALFGITPSGIKDPQNIYNEDTCLVELEFNLDKKHYVVTRTKRPSGLSIKVDGKDISGKGIRDTEQILTNHLGSLTSELLNAVIILGQGLPHKLTSHTPSGRKELLEKLSQSDFMIEDLKSKVGNHENFLKNEKREIENDLLKNENSYNHLQQNLQKYESEYKNLQKTDVNDLQKRLKELSVTNLEKEMKELSENIDTKSITEKQNELTELLSQKAVLEDTTKLNEELIELRSKALSKKEELRRIKEIKTTCPTCNQKIPHEHIPDTTSLEKELSDILTLGKSKKEVFDEIEKRNNEKESAFKKEIETKKKKLQDKMKVITESNNQVQLLLKEKQENLVQIKLEKQQIETKLNTLEESKKKLELEIKEVKEELNKNLKEKETLEEKEEKNDYSLKIVNKMVTILKRDFRGVLLQNVINYLQTRFDDYALRVYGNKKLKIEIDGNNLNIKYNSKLYESLSGGEKTKVDIIIQLSIRDLLCQQFQFYSNVLVIDEVTDFLDEKSAEQVYQLFSQLNVEQLYIISHRKDFTFPIDNELVIVKRDNYSSILER